MGGVDDLGGADGGEVTVALVGKDHRVLADGALDASGDSGGAAVRGLVHVAVEVVIREHGAAHGGHADHFAVELHLVDDLRDKTVDDAVVAAGAVMELLVGQQFGLFKQNSHLISPPSC